MLNLKIFYKATVIKTMWYWSIDQWNRLESLELDPHKYSQSVFKKDNMIDIKQSFQIVVQESYIRKEKEDLETDVYKINLDKIPNNKHKTDQKSKCKRQSYKNPRRYCLKKFR